MTVVEDNENEVVTIPAKVVATNGPVYTIKYLVPDKNNLYRYEDKTYEITNESIEEYAETEEDLGFRKNTEDTFIYDSDSDYIPSEENSSTDSESSTDEEKNLPEY